MATCLQRKTFTVPMFQTSGTDRACISTNFGPLQIRQAMFHFPSGPQGSQSAISFSMVGGLYAAPGLLNRCVVRPNSTVDNTNMHAQSDE